jgi:hypothetical protein
MPGSEQPLRTIFEASTEDIGERILWMPDGDDLPFTIVAAPENDDGVKVPNGGDLKAAVARGGTIRLERGGSYRPGSIRISRDDTKLLTFGDASKPMPRVAGYIECDDRKGLTIEGIHFDGVGIKSTGIRCYNTDRIRIAGCRIEHFEDFGIRIQGYGGKRCSGVAIEANLVANNSGDQDSKDSGLHFINVDGAIIRANVFDTNGWRPGKVGSTIYNHNVYIHASCGPVAVLDNVFYNASSHGLQQRSGGDCKGNLFLDNPIHQSYGYVKGDSIFKGGVSGEISGNVYIGGRDISSGPSAGKRGWAVEIGNVKDATIADCLIAHDNQGTEQAIIVRKCEDVKGSARDVKIKKLEIERIYCWAWPKGVIEIKDGLRITTQNRVGGAPPTSGNLRDALGSEFMTRARANPADAAKDGVRRCRSAVGL